MPLPSVPGLTIGWSGLASLAAFMRDRLGEVGPMAGSVCRSVYGSVEESLATSLRSRREDEVAAITDGRDARVRELAVIIVTASAQFAPTAYARARLLRQMHASGLLSDHETEQAQQLFGVAQ
jgi:hypothetical protein